MEINAIQAGFNLDHIAIETKNKKKLEHFYNDIMKMKSFQGYNKDIVCVGPSRKLIIKEGVKNKLSFVGFSCRSKKDLNSFKSFVKKNDVKITNFENPYLQKGSFSILDPDKNIISFGIKIEKKIPMMNLLHGPLQHLTFSSLNVENFKNFYCERLGFKVTDIVVNKDGSLATCFITSNHEHHTLACFKSKKVGIDHHSYEVGDWNYIRDWCDHFASKNIQLLWGPGRHGPGNNLFVFIEDTDKNWIELSAELEIIHDREKKIWPQAEKTLNLWGKAILRS